ncbi:MAG: IPExxxVDY family protein [Bacteroidales bacterium]|nr:IPExxxVDY family protein [Bacteroidales bacterium]
MQRKKNFIRFPVAQRPTHYLAIVSSDNDYRLCWLLNEQLGISLTVREEPITARLRSGATVFFQQYVYEDENYTYCLITNRTPYGVLVNDLPQTDYILRIDGELTPDMLDGIVRRIRQLPAVNMINVVEDGEKISTRLHNL